MLSDHKCHFFFRLMRWSYFNYKHFNLYLAEQANCKLFEFPKTLPKMKNCIIAISGYLLLTQCDVIAES